MPICIQCYLITDSNMPPRPGNAVARNDGEFEMSSHFNAENVYPNPYGR